MGGPQIPDKGVPLCVDLDGTLIRADMLVRSVAGLVRLRPFCSALIPFWLMGGKAHLKRQLAVRVAFDPSGLPYNQALLEILGRAKDEGRYLVLATASDVMIGEKIAGYLRIFDEVMGSDGVTNLRGRVKAEVLSSRFGVRGYDYAGNSETDLPVWEKCREALVVGGRPGLAGKAEKLGVGREGGGRVEAASCTVRRVLCGIP